MTLRMLAAVTFLTLQVILIVRAQFIASRDFCWAPHTTQVRFALQVEVPRKRLTETEIASRYRFWHYGWEAHSYQNLIDVITQYEQTYGKDDQAQVLLQYSVNGREPHVWKRP